MDIELLQNPAADSSRSNSKRKKKQRAKEKALEKNDPEIMDQNLEVLVDVGDCLSRQTLVECPKADAGSTGNLSESNTNEQMKNLQKEVNETTSNVDVQIMDQTKMDTESTKISVERNGNGKRKRGGRKNKKKKKHKDAIQSMDQTDDMLHNDGKLNVLTAQESEISLEKESSLSYLVKDNEDSLDLSKKDKNVLLPNVVEASCGRVSSDLLEERSGDFLRPMEVEEKLVVNEINNEIVVDKGKCLAEGRSVDLTHISYPDVKDVKDCGPCLQIASVSCTRKKLLVLDVNGLLANIVFPAPKDCRGDTHILGRAVFKRPFCDDFLKFCFQNFAVGIWSSRSKKLIDRVVEYLLGDLQDQMMFCWDMSHSTQTGFKTLENQHKPLVCKELRKIWESDGPDLRWKKGNYNESNTLLLDDSPYKALLNPLHTAVFPNSYRYEDKNDNSLGPGGDLRVYLEGLLTSENVQKYVEQHPFGQSAINESSLSWAFYSGVLHTLSTRVEDNTLNTLTT